MLNIKYSNNKKHYSVFLFEFLGREIIIYSDSYPHFCCYYQNISGHWLSSGVCQFS